MFGWIDIGLLSAALVLLGCGFVLLLRPYRSLFWGSSVLALISALFPRHGNLLGQYLFGSGTGAPRLPLELFGIAWWVLGAWLVKSLLDLALRRTVFPDDNQPHARRLFADLASGLIYVVAFAGIMDTVLKEPISAVVATSGVLAIVLGLALQNTLADVFSGLAINIERPFGAGDWITLTDGVEGQVIEINWRATRVRTAANAMIVIPNSIAAKAIVTNHSRFQDPLICTIRVSIDHKVSTARVIDALESAASDSPGIASAVTPQACACAFSDTLIDYELTFAVYDYLSTANVRSVVIGRVAGALLGLGIQIGALGQDLRIIQDRGVGSLASDDSRAPAA